MRYKCVSAISALASFHFSECILFYPSCLLYGEDFFKLFAPWQTRDIKWYVTKSMFVAITFSWQKKKDKKLDIVRMHNAMARTGLETNSLGDVSLGKGKALLLQ